MKAGIGLFLAMLFLFSSAWAKGSGQGSLILSPLQFGARYVQQLNTDMIWQNNSSWGIGGRLQRHTLLLDYNRSSDASGNQTLTFKKERTEMMLSYRYAVYSLNAFLDLGVGLGVGVYEDVLKSRLGVQEISEATGYQPSVMGVTSLGGNWNYLFYTFELQVLAGKDFEPQPTLGGLVRVGIQFAIF